MSVAGAKKQPNDWRGAPPDYSLYAPIPHLAEDFLAPLTPTQIQIVNWLKGQGKRQANDTWVCGQLSYAAIARGTRLHWTTVARNTAELREKQSLDTREVWARDQKGGRRVGTLYSIPSYSDALARRRAIPDAAVTPAGHVLFIGRAKRFMTREDAALWGIDLAKVPATGTRQPSVTHARVPRNAPLAEMPAPSAAARVDEETVLQALLVHCPAELDDAQRLIAAARGSAPEVPISVIVKEIADIAARKEALRKKGDKRPLNFGWFLNRIAAHVAKWQAAERVRAKDAARQALFDREERLNRIAVKLAALAKLGDGHGEALPDGGSERQFLLDAIAAADPAEVEAARGIAANARSMSA